jgi:AcrR family transcriptional regulator
MTVSDRHEREFKRREREILEAAVELFSTLPWEEVTIAQIAKRAEVGKGTVYKHFASKDELIGRIVLDERRAFFWKLRQAMEPGLDSLQEAARRVVQVCWERYMSNPRFIQRLDQYIEQHDFTERIGPGLARELRTVEEGMLSLFWDGLSSGIDRGYFTNGDLPLRISTAWATVSGAIRLAASPGRTNILEGRMDSFRDEVASFILRGLGWREEQ